MVGAPARKDNGGGAISRRGGIRGARFARRAHVFARRAVFRHFLFDNFGTSCQTGSHAGFGGFITGRVVPEKPESAYQ